MSVETKTLDEQRIDDSILQRVKKVVVENLSVEADKVVPEARLVEELGADSLDTVELVMALETEFGCTISDDVAEKIKTVGDAVAHLQAETHKQPAESAAAASAPEK